ncbi:hypothetical protein [Bosea sp. (in: a-proteobacteria)]|uniref:hypothetical protein n=1 Tax=Bosea sp. (in: a-proteobacteria) TaxID=1871050 RepID=UPI001AD12CD9|nr:hypothetical protein [Bosea sp. (in: a-proteobacteria)]MBN9441183.1 hypothetical protein [Bosea sp. (in: a-proteobacteria)]
MLRSNALIRMFRSMQPNDSMIPPAHSRRPGREAAASWGVRRWFFETADALRSPWSARRSLHQHFRVGFDFSTSLETTHFHAAKLRAIKSIQEMRETKSMLILTATAWLFCFAIFLELADRAPAIDY